MKELEQEPKEGNARRVHADDGWYTPQWLNIADMPLIPDPTKPKILSPDDAWENARQEAMKARWK